MEIKVVKKVLDANATVASESREFFKDKGVFVMNMMSSPGSGKTATLEKTLSLLMPEIRCAVIVGDICTTNDAQRLAKSGAPVVQINTEAFGGTCHLPAPVVKTAVKDIDLDNVDFLIVENVGNLVCPADMDIGEDVKTVVLSTTEGEDKPLKYPLMFRVCQAALLNKTDLIPYLDFDLENARQSIHQVNPGMPVFEISAKTGDGFTPWIQWIKERIAEKAAT